MTHTWTTSGINCPSANIFLIRRYRVFASSGSGYWWLLKPINFIFVLKSCRSPMRFTGLLDRATEEFDERLGDASSLLAVYPGGNIGGPTRPAVAFGVASTSGISLFSRRGVCSIVDDACRFRGDLLRVFSGAMLSDISPRTVRFRLVDGEIKCSTGESARGVYAFRSAGCPSSQVEMLDMVHDNQTSSVSRHLVSNSYGMLPRYQATKTLDLEPICSWGRWLSIALFISRVVYIVDVVDARDRGLAVSRPTKLA